MCKTFTPEVTVDPILLHIVRAFTEMVPAMPRADTRVVLGSALMFIRVCYDWCVARPVDAAVATSPVSSL